MKLEHFALNVADPTAMALWYEEHLGMKTVRKMEQAPFTHFIADNSGRIMIEIYNNPADSVPSYDDMDPLIVHLAFVSENPDADKEKLLAAGATFVSDNQFDDGTHLLMLRDPWGLAIQFCKRGLPMLADKE